MASTAPTFVMPPFNGGFYLAERNNVKMYGVTMMDDTNAGYVPYMFKATGRTYEMVTHPDCCRDPIFVVGLGTRPLTAGLQPGWGFLFAAPVVPGDDSIGIPADLLGVDEFLSEITVKFGQDGLAVATAKSNQKSELITGNDAGFFDQPAGDTLNRTVGT